MLRMSKMLVSLVVANLNGKDLLRECLDSLKKNTSLKRVEVFASDGGSTDGSQQMIKKEFPWIKLLNNSLKGYGSAINYGFRKAKGEYLVMLNNDLYFLPRWLDCLIETAESDPKIGAVGARMVGKDESPQRYDKLGEVEKQSVCGACILIKRKVWKQVGEIDYDNFKPIYGEETDWTYRARHYGYKIIQSNSSKVIHLGSTTQNSVLGKKRNTFLRYTNTYRAILANLSLAEILQALPGQLLVFFNSFSEGTALNHVQALLENLKHFGHVLTLRGKRKEAEKKRVPLKCFNAAPQD